MSKLFTPIRSMLPLVVFATDNSVRQRYFWWRWADSHRRPQQLLNNFYELLQYKKYCYHTYSKCTGTHVESKTFYFIFFYTIFARHYRILSSNQITKRKLKPPANIFKAPNCLSFCSGVQSFFQYLFIVFLL